MQNHVIGANREGVLHPEDAVQNTPMGDFDTLWATGRAGGEQHIGKVIGGVDRIRNIGIFAAIDDQDFIGVKQIGQIGGGDNARIAKIIKHIRAALFGVIGVKGAICRTA